MKILDLTESNPTHAGILYPSDLVQAFADERVLTYEPEPFGLPLAREAIGTEYGVPYDRVVMSASTSEAYSWLFKLFCDPGDRVLIPRPSYPLFEYLAALECVGVDHYSLFYDGGWFIDFHTLNQAITNRTKAVVLVNPNNPTGHFLRRHEREELVSLCASKRIAIISDEVFSDYQIAPSPEAVTSLRTTDEALTFCLNGLSKTVGLPQMKLAWTFANGPGDWLREAMARLEIIADTYLSVGTPVQTALPRLLGLRTPVQQQIVGRLGTNLGRLIAAGLRTLRVEAGWYAVILLPPGRREEEWAELLLEEHGILIQPGFFYDFERSGFAVLSLLTPPETFSAAIGTIAGLH